MHFDANGAWVLQLIGICRARIWIPWARVAAVHLRFEFAIPGLIDAGERSSAGARSQGDGRRQAASSAKYLQEARSLRINSRKLPGFFENNCPGVDGKNQQDAENDASHPSRLLNQRIEAAGKKERRQAGNRIPPEKSISSSYESTVAHASGSFKQISQMQGICRLPLTTQTGSGTCPPVRAVAIASWPGFPGEEASCAKLKIRPCRSHLTLKLHP